MLQVTRVILPSILASDDGPVAEVINPSGAADMCLVCEHASPAIPSSLNGLGLAEDERLSHAAWDIGALDLTRALAERLDAPAVVARISRLVYDCNRPPDAPGAITERSENIVVAGNQNLPDAARAARIAEIYEPFHATVTEALDGFRTPPALVTIHSFTPVWMGQPRDVELGLLHDTDDRLAKAMMAHRDARVDTQLNAPYDAHDGVTHMLQRHALPRGLQNVMIEVRNDLIDDPEGVERFADILAPMLTQALVREATA